MDFLTIWTVPKMDLRERINRTKEWGAIVIAGKLPKRVRYWTTIREMGKATKNMDEIMSASLDEILKNLDSPKHNY